jgi:hypothetical protein
VSGQKHFFHWILVSYLTIVINLVAEFFLNKRGYQGETHVNSVRGSSTNEQ